MDKNGLPWEENDYVKMNICVQINGLKMQQFWTDSLDDPVEHEYSCCYNLMQIFDVFRQSGRPSDGVSLDAE